MLKWIDAAECEAMAFLDPWRLPVLIRREKEIRVGRRHEVSGGGATTNSATLRELKAANSKLHGPVEIVIQAIARFHSRVDQVIHQ
jgi:hypothetical protein